MAGRKCEPGCPCKRHRGNGGRKVGRKRVEHPSKVARHDRVRYARGRADLYSCVSCDRRARDWAQVHGGDPLDVLAYQPMCRGCHLVYDSPHDSIEELMSAMRRGEGRIA